MNLKTKIFQLPIIGDALFYVCFGPIYILRQLLNPLLFWMGGFRPMKYGTTAIWVPDSKKETVRAGIELLRLSDPQLFIRLSEKQHLLILYAGNKENISSPSNRCFGLAESYIKWGAEGVAMFVAYSVWRSEEKIPFNIFKRNSDPYLARKLLDWMCKHAFSPAIIKGYTKTVEKREQAWAKLANCY